MKITDLVLKITACVMTAAAVICLVMANMEKISACLDGLFAKLQEKKSSLCKCCCQTECYDDEFEDWDV